MSLVLSESAPRHLAYPAGGLRADLRLLELDEGLLESIRRDGVVIKGAEGEEAMLCTSSKTFLLKVVETTNTLLLLPPPQQVEQGEGDSARPSQSPGAGRDSGNLRDAEPHACRREAAGPKGRPCLRATATLASHIELVEAAPRLGALPALLGRPYSLEDEQQQQQQEEEEGGYSTEQLLARVQASRAELEAELRRLQAVQLGGMWRLVDEGYLGDLLEMVLMSALQRGWSMDAVPVGEAAAAMVPDGYLPELTHHCLRVFGRPGGQPPPQAAGATICSQGGGSGSSGSSSSSHCALDREAVALHFARKLLRQRQVWGLGAFMDAWRQAVPFPHEPSPEALRGEALLLQPQDGDGCPEPQLQHFPARLLPAEPAARFAALFRCRPRWTRGELDPYLAGLAVPGQTVETLLLKYARASQRSPSDPTVVFVAR